MASGSDSIFEIQPACSRISGKGAVSDGCRDRRLQWGPNLRYRTAAFAGNQGRDLYNELVQLYQFLKELIP